jgi:hypothetical protein
VPKSRTPTFFARQPSLSDFHLRIILVCLGQIVSV